MGYIMGKAEGSGEQWHGHVSAVTVAPEFRRMGLARTLMRNLEDVSERRHDAYFVDLFVRVSNTMVRHVCVCPWKLQRALRALPRPLTRGCWR